MDKRIQKAQRSQAYEAKMHQKQHQRLVDEDKKVAEMFEVQNRMMTSHMENFEIKKTYNKWLEKVWGPAQKKEQEKKATEAKKAQAAAEQKAKELVPAKAIDKEVRDRDNV